METETAKPKKKWSFSKKLLTILGILIVIISIGSIYLYNNFNKLVAQALVNSFNAGAISDVYELKFDRLNVNLLLGSLQVHDVVLKPKEKPTVNYYYINSSMDLHAKKILLYDVEIFTLLKTNILRVKRVEVLEPDIEVKQTGRKMILFPFRDTADKADVPIVGQKGFIAALVLKEFAMVNASLHLVNEFHERDLAVKNLSLSFKDLLLKQDPGRDYISNRQVDLSVGEVIWRLKKGGVQSIIVGEYRLKVDSLSLQTTPDTTIFGFKNFTTGLKVFNMQTADSLFNLTTQALNFSYRDSFIILKDIKFDPNMSDAAMQRRFVYQNPVFSGTVGTIKLTGLNVDSLIYANEIFVDEVMLDKVNVSIFKDLTKPVNKNRLPQYPGQQLRSIEMPFRVKQLTATNVNLKNVERKSADQVGRIDINRMSVEAKNITNLSSNGILTVNANAFIENKAHTFLSLAFLYSKPQFSIKGNVRKFELPGLNQFLKSFTPATVNRGIADEMVISATAYRTNVDGQMKFLYHDLNFDLDLKDQANWKSDLLTFVGNTITQSSNPSSPDLPPRVVQFKADRDMYKGFINVLVKSAIAGLKQTMFMSKENRKNYRQAKKKARKESAAKD